MTFLDVTIGMHHSTFADSFWAVYALIRVVSPRETRLTKLVAMSREASGWSMGTRWPALKTTLN